MPSQAKFAKLLTEAMEVLEVSNVELGAATGTHPTTVSRYRDTGYRSGPPHPSKRRAIESYMGLPEGYLDGEARVDLEAIRGIRRTRRDQERLAKKGLVREEEGGEGPAALFQQALVALEREARGSGTVSLATAVQWVATVFTAATRDVAPGGEEAKMLDRLEAAALTDPPRPKSSKRAG